MIIVLPLMDLKKVIRPWIEKAVAKLKDDAPEAEKNDMGEETNKEIDKLIRAITEDIETGPGSGTLPHHWQETRSPMIPRFRGRRRRARGTLRLQ